MRNTGSLGQFEQVVLTAVLTLGDDAYGLAIHAKVQQLSGARDVNLGSVYVALDRLEEKGMVSSKPGESTPERGGRPRRYFRIEPPGEYALRESMQIARRLYEAAENSWSIRRWKPRGAR